MILKSLAGVVILVGIYYIYKYIRKKMMINKDYNRKVSKEDLGIRKDLAFLREELLKTDNPNTRNEILNKIQIIVDSNSMKGKEDE